MKPKQRAFLIECRDAVGGFLLMCLFLGLIILSAKVIAEHLEGVIYSVLVCLTLSFVAHYVYLGRD